jgi:serine/threonine protein kinase
MLPGYSDLGQIGSGAFATVYRAIENETGRPVALKILHVDAVSGRLLETFAKEIRALGRVSDHPNIVTLYRPLMTADGRPVLVLELCRESMAQRLRRTGPVGAREATRIAIKVAGALETAHRRGFLHRDLKPQNILVTQFGEPALGDFGVAALQSTARASGGLVGFTTLHAAPEVLEGHALSPATDVYGLASSTYQLLSGVAPFAAYDNEAPASVILRIIRDPVRPLRAEGVPVELSDVLESAMAKPPESRPQSAAELAAAFSAVEAANGWPSTTFVAWDADPSSPAPAPAARTRPRPELPPFAARSPIPADSPLPFHSVGLAEVDADRPAVDSRPAADPAHEGAPALSDRSASEPEPPSDPAVGRLPMWVPAPPPPPAPAPRLGPSIASPAGGGRQVVPPDQPRRGNPRPAVSSSANPPLAPLPSASEASRFRPVFVDPPGPSAAGADSVEPESPYEQTLLPVASRLDVARAPSSPAAAGSPASPVPLLRLAGVVAAIVVLIAALLLVAGVL